jgi:hypothetical protein
MEYLRLRKGVADIHRRAELGQKINERYAAALATVEDKTPLGELTQDLVRPTTWKGRSVRALNPLAPADLEVLEAINRGEFMLNGFRNRDLRALLFADVAEATPEEAIYERAVVKRGGADFVSRAPAHPLRRRLRSILPISDLSADDLVVQPATHPLSPRPRESFLPQGRQCTKR